MCLLLTSLTKVTIASLNGAAVGFGFTLSLACDLRIASEKARMNMAFVRIGYIPEMGSTFLLPRIVGITKACELTFTGRMIDANEAKEIGILNQVVPSAELKDATFKLASSITPGAPLTIQLAKRGLYQGLHSDLNTQLFFERLAVDYILKSRDFAEGVKAFLEKRKAVFTGD